MRPTERPLALLASLLLAGCCGLEAQYVRADRLIFEAVAPEYRAYVEGDQGLTPEERARRARTLEAWEARLREAERADRPEEQEEVTGE